MDDCLRHQDHLRAEFDAMRNRLQTTEDDLRELKRLHEQSRSMFERPADGFLVANAQTGEFLMANEAFSEMTGYDSEEITSLSVRDIHPADSLHQVVEAFER